MINNRLIIFKFVLCLLASSVVSGGEAQQQGSHAVIAQYHHVSNDTPPSTSISPEHFLQHMNYFHDNGFSVLPLETVMNGLKSGVHLGDKVLVITFDDGYKSIYDTAFPILQQLNFPFTVFISTEPIDKKQSNFMTWEQIREMSDTGVTIANHTQSHPYMLDWQSGENKNSWLSRLRLEIAHAENRILEETGQTHQILAYPYGEYNTEIQNLLREMDYIGIAQHSGAIGSRSDFLALPRFPLSGIYSNFETMKTKMNTLPFEILVQEPRSPVSEDSSPTVTLQLNKLSFNWEQINCFANGNSIPLRWIDKNQGIFSITATEESSSRRWRYNCTAPQIASSRFYWYSKAWVRASEINNQ